MPIECKLRQIPKNSTSSKNLESPMKFGRYLRSIFPKVKGYGESHWVVGCYVDFDHESAKEVMTEEEMIEEIVNHLNKIPPRQKFQRQPTSSLYGRLELLSYKLKKANGVPFIEMLLITDDPNNDNFWGEGDIYVGTKKSRRSRKDKKVLT